MKQPKQKKEFESGKTLFARNLHESVTKADLETHFGGIGPLRHAFLVTSPGSTSCKGYGFITFAFAEDAERARTLLSESLLKGRKMFLDNARRRIRSSDDKQTKEDMQPSKQKGTSNRGKKGTAVGSVSMRTVLLQKRSKEDTITEDEAKIAVGADRNGSGFQVCILSSDRKLARCTFDSWSNAGKAAANAHGDAFDAVIEALKGGQRTTLIVRNLPFRVDAKQLRAVFQAVAPIRSMRLAPPSELRRLDKPRKRKNRSSGGDDTNTNTEDPQENVVPCAGYAFIEYFLVSFAKHAMSKLNGTKVGNRVIAVDMALSKSQYVAQGLNQELEDQDIPSEDEEVQASKGNDTEGGSEVIQPQKPCSEEKNDNNTSPKVLESSNQLPKPLKPKERSTNPNEMARTVFVRNLLFETSAGELRQAMVDRFGKVDKTLLVKDPKTGRPRGTAFVIFKSEDSARKAVNHTVPSEPGEQSFFESDAGGFVLQGRRLLLTMAVDRSKAKDLKSTIPLHAKKDKEDDPRNFRLAWIGHIQPNTKEAFGLSPKDLARRATAEKEKKTKLERNPNAFVSDVRLSIRNLPRECDEKMLKHMCLLAAREKAERNEQDKSAELPKVTHVTVVRDTERKDRSKGYGFVQFTEHSHALNALLHLNNNPRVMEWLVEKKPKALRIDEIRAGLLQSQWGRNRRLIVEFAVEDRRIVQVLDRVREKGREMSEKKRKAREPEEEGDRPRKKKRRRTARNDRVTADVQEEHRDVVSKPRSEKRFERKKQRYSLKPSTGPQKSETDRTGAKRPAILSEKEDTVFQSKGAAHKTGRKKNRPKKVDEEDKFERLVGAYKKKLVSTEGKKQNSGLMKVDPKGSGPPVRWF
ncbi:putative RNA-binding protein [Gracilariopsis chorda]|uniref:Putative RNA-binding protein n=1 Tax=Gracilariopsis chorda TaxID=448386 RepID=A0A2V3IG94_9FLOR|nr:putative RNA-binding protein [Gracilariopsis chorda]|eukprot:PXF41116.1 putative RNA-binding protein [Gracilariopsis chorda]